MIFQSFLISLMSNLVAQEFPNHSYRFQKYDLAQKLHCSQKRKYDAVPCSFLAERLLGRKCKKRRKFSLV